METLSIDACGLDKEPSNTEERDLIEAGSFRNIFQNERGIVVHIDRTRDRLLTRFGMSTLEGRYLLDGEGPQDMFARVAAAYADDSAHAQRIYDHMSKLWFMPSTPVLANASTRRGLPISCFLNETEDSLEDIVRLWNENVWLAALGGGIGSYWGNLRGIGERFSDNGKTGGVIPFIRVTDSLSMAISQGSLRRGAAACYMPISHPEIEEFIEIRRPTGGDPNRKALNIHHGVLVSDAFMHAVETDSDWPLVNPATNAVQRTLRARSLWIRLLTARIETGEPYVIFSDTVNRALPEHHKLARLSVKVANLCSEIMLPTGIDQHGVSRTAVCCLASVNLERYDEWRDAPGFVDDAMRFLDNCLTEFISRAPDSLERARYAASQERSVGLGAMGFHSLLQQRGIAFESAEAEALNEAIFSRIKADADESSKRLAAERGACPDAAQFGFAERFSNKIAIAPTASISIICGGASPGIEPIAANSYTHKTLSGSFNVRNRYLEAVLERYGRNTAKTWSSITINQGSVQHLDFLSDDEKRLFRTAFEIDQRWLVRHAAARAPFVCQGQSLNLFLAADVHKRDLHQMHFLAWKSGVKSLYYCRSRSIQRAESSMATSIADWPALPGARREVGDTPAPERKLEDCMACQ